MKRRDIDYSEGHRKDVNYRNRTGNGWTVDIKLRDTQPLFSLTKANLDNAHTVRSSPYAQNLCYYFGKTGHSCNRNQFF